MSILVYDTETTDKPLWDQRSHDERQPHIVQIGWVEYSDDGTEVSARSLIVKPNGWVSAPEALAVHKITHEQAMETGIPEDHVVALWLVAQARSNLRVAHNPYFDDRIMKIAMVRAAYDRSFIDLVLARPKFDTCRAATKIVALPPSPAMAAKDMRFSKSPKLTECAKYFFDVEPDGSHDAMWDARMCGRLYWHLKGLEGAA